jgi:hypothetical protein
VGPLTLGVRFPRGTKPLGINNSEIVVGEGISQLRRFQIFQFCFHEPAHVVFGEV